MKFTYRKTLSIAPYGIEEFIVEEDVCPTELVDRIRTIRGYMKDGLKPGPSEQTENQSDEK